MSWTDRLKEAAYTSPSGTRIRFDYENVGRDVTKRTTAFEFPNVNDAYVQDNGHGSRRYQLRCIFWGSDHDILATAFEAALLERGVGKLEHPLYGTFNVVPFGDITRRDDLKESANHSVIEVTFWSTLGAIYPSSQLEPKNEILAALEGMDVALAQQFADSVNLTTALSKANARATTTKMLDSAKSLESGSASLDRDFIDLHTSVSLGLDVLLESPSDLAANVTALVKTPAAVVGDIQTQLGAIVDFVESIMSSDAGQPAAALTSGTAILTRRIRIANDFHLAHLFAFAGLSAAALACANHTFSTKPEAIKAAETVLDAHDALVEWSDDGFAALGALPTIGTYQIDTGEAYQALLGTVASTAGFLVQASFILVPERRIVLDRARTIIDLCAELYGTVDDKLDFLINSNNLTGDQILELEAGTVILYYKAA